MNKRIVCYFINFNDSFYLPFLAKHYGSFCERIVMYDNYSTDNSVELAKSLGFEVRYFGIKGVLDDQIYLDIKNHCWKECRGKGIDYVIVCDADEFVCIDDLQGTSPIVTGYNIISDNLPKESIFELNTGEYSESYSKQAIFSPDAINEINFVHGCHKNYIQGLISKTGSCRLIHFRQIGGIERMLERHSEYRKRMSAFNLKHGMGVHYLHSDEQKINEWNTLKERAVKLW